MCKSAGIIPVMITGDHPVTARAIASALGMFSPGDMVVTGGELRRLSDAQLAERIGRPEFMPGSTPSRRSGLSRRFRPVASSSQ